MTSVRRLPLTALAATLALTLTGCAAFEDEGTDDRLSVAAGFYPLAWVAEQVVGDHAEVVNLTRPGQEAHDSELSLANTAKLADADLVIIEAGFQPALDDAVEENATGEVLEVTETITLRRTGDDHHDDEGHEGHDHEGDLDPHFWLDPLLMADVADAVAADLGALEPALAPDFDEAANELRAELTKLDTAYAEGLAGCARDTVVVSHDAFGYLSRYGLHFEPIAGLSPGAEPTPADLARLQEVIRSEGITTVFTETLAPPALAGQLAEDMNVRTAVLDPVEGLTDSTSGEDYLSLMQRNLDTLKKANKC